jgi:hypothetical protein
MVVETSSPELQVLFLKQWGKSMPQWLVIVLVVAALAVAYKFFIHKGPGHKVPLAVAKGPSKKSRWRRLAGNAMKMAAPSIPGMGQAMQIGGALGAGV